MSKKSIRSSQIITTYGVGGIIVHPEESFMTAGLDEWYKNVEPEVVSHNEICDDRLAHRLGVDYFMSPPVPVENVPNLIVPLVRFPHWYYCPRCHSLKHVDWNESGDIVCKSEETNHTRKRKIKSCKELDKERKQKEKKFNEDRKKRGLSAFRGSVDKHRVMHPYRFIVICKRGHIDNFPWVKWAHSKEGDNLSEIKSCESHNLEIIHQGGAGLNSLEVCCNNCGKRRKLGSAVNSNGIPGLKCSGRRPWFGSKIDKEDCIESESPSLSHLGSSSTYFPVVESSILIPRENDKLCQILDVECSYKEIIREKIDDVSLPNDQSVMSDCILSIAKGIVSDSKRNKRLRRYNFDFKEIETIIRNEWKHQLINNDDDLYSETLFKYKEYTVLTGNDINSDEFVSKELQINDFIQVGSFFNKISMVKKLSETRAFVGFSRKHPSTETAPYDDLKRMISINPQNWLPAVRVKGEGLFLELDMEKVAEWSSNQVVREHIRNLAEKYIEYNQKLGSPQREFGAGYLLVHSLAHALIKRLSYECGYGSSSIRERIYWSEKPDSMMCGILIYTSAGDSEGTLGGLVEQAKPENFENILISALNDALNCSSDPVCIESKGQGMSSLNLAACHTCLLLPETCCENRNILLDRAMLVGGDNPKLSYFDDLINKV